MSAKKYIVRLSQSERQYLLQLVKTGRVAAYKRQRAQILLQADIGSGKVFGKKGSSTVKGSTPRWGATGTFNRTGLFKSPRGLSTLELKAAC